MSVMNRSSFAKALWPGVNAWYGKAYNDYQPEWDKLFEKYTSDRAYEEDVGLSSFGLAVQKPEGNGISYDSERQGFTTRYSHVVYALGFIITREMYEDSLYAAIGQKKATALARSMRLTKEILAANVYNNAFTGGATGGDGQQLISNAHPNVAGGTWSNRPTTYADLSEAALEQAVIDIANFRDDRGLQIAVRAKSLHIPMALVFEAERILKTSQRVGTANNDINALKDMGYFPGGIHVNHYFTDPDAWFIRTDVGDGMKYFERRADSFDMDNDFDTENAKFKATARYSFGWTDPRALYASTGA